MQCKLCLEEKKLSKSHIIPEYFYEPIKDTVDNQILVISNNPAENKNRVVQTGTWEYLLCADCEKLINENFEKPMVSFFRYAWELENIPSEKILKFNVDYSTLKLLQMSILWRASISTKKDFENVTFHLKHKEKLRELIFNKDPGINHEFGCLMYLLVNKGKVYNNILQHPWKNNDRGNTIISFLFGGFVWSFVIASDYSNFPLKKYFLKENNVLLTRTVNYGEQKYFKKLAYQIAEQGKIKKATEFFKNKKPK